MTAAAVSPPTGAPLPPGSPPKSRSKRQREQSFDAGFVVHLDWLTEGDRARAARIIQANKIGWPAEIHEVFHQYGERLAPLDPDELRALYLQARRDVSGASDKPDEYLELAWLPYKAAKGPAYLTGHAGDGRGAHAFVDLIAALRGHCFRNFSQRRGDGKWLRHEWFEDQETLGREICYRRETVNRLLKDPDMDAWVVKVPRRWYDCRVSGGASRVASYRYLVAFEDPLVPDQVAPIQERLRELLDERLAAIEEEAREQGRAGQDQCESNDGGELADDRTDRTGQWSRDNSVRAASEHGATRTYNAATISHTQRYEKISQQSLTSERTPSERGVRRSAREEESSAWATRKTSREEGAPNTGHTAQQPAEGRANEESHIEPHRTSSPTRTARATAELVDKASGVSAPRSLVSAAVGVAAGAAARSICSAGEGREMESLTSRQGDTAASVSRPSPQRGVRATSDAGAPPVGVDLAGEALLSERGLREERLRAQIGPRAYHLLRKLEDRDTEHTQRDERKREQSAMGCANFLIEELAKAEIPEDAAPAFLTWIYDRVYRLAKRDAHGVRVPFDAPAGYYLTTARSMIPRAIKANWACEDLNEREWREDRLRSEKARWKADEQARRDAEWAQREQELRDYEFAQWQLEQRREEEQRQARSGASDASWGEELREVDALGYVAQAMAATEAEIEAGRARQEEAPPRGGQPRLSRVRIGARTSRSRPQKNRRGNSHVHALECDEREAEDREVVESEVGNAHAQGVSSARAADVSP